jgi:hypothetical protein
VIFIIIIIIIVIMRCFLVRLLKYIDAILHFHCVRTLCQSRQLLLCAALLGDIGWRQAVDVASPPHLGIEISIWLIWLRHSFDRRSWTTPDWRYVQFGRRFSVRREQVRCHLLKFCCCCRHCSPKYSGLSILFWLERTTALEIRRRHRESVESEHLFCLRNFSVIFVIETVHIFVFS